MPIVKPLSEFNRNQSSMLQELHETGMPIYLSRNGSSAIVVMDAEAFDREMSLRQSAIANEIRVYDALVAGYADYLDGNVVEANVAEQSILKDNGWS